MTKDDQMALAKWIFERGSALKAEADAMPKSRQNSASRNVAQGRANGVLFLVQDVLSDTFPLVPRRK